MSRDNHLNQPLSYPLIWHNTNAFHSVIFTDLFLRQRRSRDFSKFTALPPYWGRDNSAISYYTFITKKHTTLQQFMPAGLRAGISSRPGVLVKGEILAAKAPFSPQKHPKINFKPPFKHFHAVFTPISPFFIILDIFHQMQRPCAVVVRFFFSF